MLVHMDKGKVLGQDMVLQLSSLIAAQAENIVRLELHFVWVFPIVWEYGF